MRHWNLLIILLCCIVVLVPAASSFADAPDQEEETNNGLIGGIGGDTGYFDISSDPSGATVTIDGSVKGTTPITVPIYSTGTPQHTITLTMDGYNPWSVTRNSPAAGQTVSVNAVLVPKPVTLPTTTSPTQIGGGGGFFEITSSPSGASVKMDGTSRGFTPVIVKVSSSGNPSHNFILTLSGYNTWTQDYYGNPQDGDTIEISADLVPVPVTPTTAPPTQIGGDTGYFRITSSPSGGTVTFDGTNIGETPAIATVYTSATPRHTITVTKSGYEDWGTTLNQNPLPGEYVDVNAVLIPHYETGTISVSSSPSGAYARLDGGEMQVTPCSFTSVSAGYHSIEITLPGYQPYQTSIKVNPSQVSSVFGSLNPIQNYGSLRVVSSPAGAELWVDEYYRGYTPLTVGGLGAGSHTAKLHLAGYQEWKATVNVPSGGTATYTPTLSPISSPSNGYITILSSPPGAAIFLDGDFQGRTMAGDPFDIIDVTPGTHTVLLKLGGFQDYTTTIKVGVGQTVPISATLTPSGAPTGMATVTVTSDPSGADLLIDNQVRGITPVTLSDIVPGSHTITMKMSGYNPYSTTIQASTGQTLQVTAALSPVATTSTPTQKSPGFIPLGCMTAICLAALALEARRRE